MWRDESGTGFATVPVRNHLENWPLGSHGFERWLSGFYYRKTAKALSAQALEDIRRTLDIKAYTEGAVYEPFLRVAFNNGRLFLDRCDDEWHAIEINPDGFRPVDRPPVKFLRAPSARALPEPLDGELIELLRGFMVGASDDEFKLIVSWLVAALRPGIPFPILIINGAQGTGKSILCKLLRRLIDPDVALVCAPPSNERDLVLAASNTWCVSLDNVSEVRGFLPDALCRLSSGGGFRTRKLHANKDEAVFFVQRPILLNGISTLTDAPTRQSARS